MAENGSRNLGDRPSAAMGRGAALPSALFRFLGAHRGFLQGAIDASALALALCFATLLRYDFAVTSAQFRGLRLLVPVAVALQVLAGVRFGIYTGRARFGSFDEVTALVKVVLITSSVLAVFNPLWDPRLAPLSVPFMGGMIALVLMSGVRYGWRLAVESRRRPSGEGRHRMIVFGAGEGAGQVIPA